MVHVDVKHHVYLLLCGRYALQFIESRRTYQAAKRLFYNMWYWHKSGWAGISAWGRVFGSSELARRPGECHELKITEMKLKSLSLSGYRRLSTTENTPGVAGCSSRPSGRCAAVSSLLLLLLLLLFVCLFVFSFLTKESLLLLYSSFGQKPFFNCSHCPNYHDREEEKRLHSRYDKED